MSAVSYEKVLGTEAVAAQAKQRKPLVREHSKRQIAVIAEWECLKNSNPKIVAVAKKYDLNGDGKFSPAEVYKMAEELQQCKQDASRLTIFAGGVLFAMVLLSVSVFGLSFAAVESAKESHVMGRAEVDLEGNRLISAEMIAKVCVSKSCIASATATGTARRLQASGATVVGTLVKSTFLEMEMRARDTNRHGSVSLTALGGKSKIEEMGAYEIRSVSDADDGSHKMTFYCDVCGSKQKYTSICDDSENMESCTVYFGANVGDDGFGSDDGGGSGSGFDDWGTIDAGGGVTDDDGGVTADDGNGSDDYVRRLATEDEFKMIEDDFKRRNRGDGRAPDSHMRLLGKCAEQ